MSVTQRSKKLKVFTGNANVELAEEICRCLGEELGQSEISRFQDGEIRARIQESVRGAEIFLVQPCNSPSDSHLMELLIMIDAMRRASAREICAVVPYYPYARQDRKTQPRDPITAKLIANLLTAAGADRVVTMDLHAGQIQGFFDIPVDNLRHCRLLLNTCRPRTSKMLSGFSRRWRCSPCRELADRLNCQIAIVDKRRPRPNVAEVMNIIELWKARQQLSSMTSSTLVEPLSRLLKL